MYAELLTDEPTDLAPPERRALVAEAFHTFHEDAARELADTLGVRFEDCVDEIEQLRILMP